MTKGAMGMTVSRAVGVRIIPIIPGVDAFARALTGASDARVGRARATARAPRGVGDADGCGGILCARARGFAVRDGAGARWMRGMWNDWM